MFHELAAGASARKVANGLTADGIPTPTGKQHWHATSISILDDAGWNGIRDRLTWPEIIAAELHRLRDKDPTLNDMQAIGRRLPEVSRKQRNLMARLAEEDNPDVATLIPTDLANLFDEGRRLEQEHTNLEIQRDGWRLAQERLFELAHWVRNVATNIDAFDYAKKRLALDLHPETS